MSSVLPKKERKNEIFDLPYYDTSGRTVLVRFFLEELRIPKSLFEINGLIYTIWYVLHRKEETLNSISRKKEQYTTTFFNAVAGLNTISIVL